MALWLAVAVCLLGSVSFAQPMASSAVEIQGVVKNGTTGKVVAGQKLILLEPSQGMQEVSSVVSDAQGHFKFEKVTGPFFVVQAHYQGAGYDQPIQPQDRGPTQTVVTVYDSTTSGAEIRVTRAQWRIVPNNGKLSIDEVFEVVNDTDPPQTLVRPDGAFKFAAPAGAAVEAASVVEAAGMPLPQTPQEITPGKLYAIDRPIQPGTTRIGVQFSADYSSQSLNFSQTLAHSIGEIDLFLPQDMQVSNAGVFQAGSSTAAGYQVLIAQNERANATVALQIAGGTAPTDDSDSGAGDDGGQSNITQLPNAIGAIQVPVISLLGLIVIWSLGFAIYQRPRQDKKGNGLTAEKRKELIDQKEYLVRRILELDRRFADQEISERDYHLQRSRLKSKCAALLQRLQPASARKREKTVA